MYFKTFEFEYGDYDAQKAPCTVIGPYKRKTCLIGEACSTPPDPLLQL